MMLAVKVLQSICQPIWKISSGCRTGKSQFSFQSQRKAMPKNVQTTAQLHSSHMATHSSVPAWRIPGPGESGGLLSMGSHRVRHDWRDLAVTSVWDECNCAVVWAFFGIAFLWDWNENWPIPVLWPLLGFPNLLSYWVEHFHSIIFQDLKLLNWNAITSTSFVHSDAF